MPKKPPLPHRILGNRRWNGGKVYQDRILSFGLVCVTAHKEKKALKLLAVELEMYSPALVIP